MIGHVISSCYIVLSVSGGVNVRDTYFCWMNSDLSALHERIVEWKEEEEEELTC